MIYSHKRVCDKLLIQNVDNQSTTYNIYHMTMCTERCTELYDSDNIRSHDWDSLICKRIHNLTSKSVTPLTFIDIGANIGAIVERLYDISNIEHIYAVEPSKSNFATLKRNIGKLDTNKVSIINAAIADHNGKIDLFCGNGTCETYNITGDVHANERKVETVDCATLEYVANKLMTRLDIIKIDVEGAEITVIESGISSINACKVAIIEIHNINTFNRLLDLGIDHKWQVLCLKNLHSIRREDWHDNFCYQVAVVPANSNAIKNL